MNAPSDAPPRISAITLNYRNVELTRRCVEALRRSACRAGLDLEIIVVDNSGTDTGEALRAALPDGVRIEVNEANRGFARACNQGIRIARGDLILLVNSDAFVTAEALETGVEYLDDNPDAGVWASRLVNEDGSLQVSCSRFPSLAGVVSEYLLGRPTDWYRNPQDWSEPREVDTVVGAFMLIPRRVVEEVGELDERYFFNVEDIDYCKRVREAGFAVVYDPRTSVTHLARGSHTDYRWHADEQLHRHRMLYFREHHSPLTAGLAALTIRLGVTLRRTLRRLPGLRP